MNSPMDSTPPPRRSEPRLRTKSTSCLTQFSDDFIENPSLTSPRKSSSLHLSPHIADSLPIRELLLLSPSPLLRSKNRPLLEKIEALDESIDSGSSRKKCSKSRHVPASLLGCGSPKNVRRARRRLEQEHREERDLGFGGEEIGKPRKRRKSRPGTSTGSTRRENLSLIPVVPSSTLPPKIDDDERSGLNFIGPLITEMIMWKDVAKSSLWFGFGSLCFSSSCFSRGFSLSIISAVSQLGLLVLATSFFYNSFSRRLKVEPRQDFKLKEEDIVGAIRAILPLANAAILKTRELFSGEPSITLKMAPVLLLAAEYGHLMTLWRLSAAVFFISFTVPKLYSCYSLQIQSRVGCLRSRLSEVWAAYSHKRIAAASAAIVFWNLSTVKTRIFSAFMSMVILRYYRQQSAGDEEDGERGGEQQQALEVVEEEGPNKKQY